MRLILVLGGLIVLAGSLALIWMILPMLFEARDNDQTRAAIMLLAPAFGLVASVRIFQAAIDD